MRSWLFHCLTICLLGFSLPLAAETAREGKQENGSLVTIELSLNVLPTIQISNVEDIRLAITDRTVDASYKEDICIKGNTGDGYTIMASGSDASGDGFALSNAQGESLPFQVLYKPSNGTAELAMEPGKPSPQFALPKLQFDCLRDLSSLSVLFTAADLQQVSPGMYRGALTLIVSPI